MSRRKGLREISWELWCDADATCIYDNGHEPVDKFYGRVVEAVIEGVTLETPPDVIDRYKPSDVRHTWFRPLSPTEAREAGFDAGVMETDTVGYPVTVLVVR